MKNIYSVVYDEYEALHNTRYDARFDECIVSSKGLYTSDMHGVKTVLINGDLVIEGDVYSEDRETYIKVQVKEIRLGNRKN